MTRFVGCDVHKRQVTVCILDEAGSVVERHRIACTREGLLDFCGTHLEATDQIALEATTHTWAVVELIEPFVQRIVVSNPLETRAIAWAKVKTDAIDARTLAQLLRAGLLPEVWRPDAETLRLRQLTHRRAALVADQTALKNRIQSTLAMRLIKVPVSRLWSTKGLEWLSELEIDSDGREHLDADLRLLKALETELAQLEKRLAEIAYQHDAVRLLMTLPGVGVAVAQGLMAAWGDVRRFPDADRAAAYLGLVPSTRQSDQACYHGRITKRGNSHARWLLIQAAQHVDDHPGPLGVFFRRLAKKKNRNIAVVTTGRKMALIAYHMLRNREPYRYALPAPTQAKLAKLRVQATGRRRRGGLPRGTPRSQTRYGTGKPMRKVPALPDVYQSEDLPQAQTPDSVTSPKGEQGRDDSEGPQHRVEFRSWFGMAAVPVTQAQYALFDPGPPLRKVRGCPGGRATQPPGEPGLVVGGGVVLSLVVAGAARCSVADGGGVGVRLSGGAGDALLER